MLNRFDTNLKSPSSATLIARYIGNGIRTEAQKQQMMYFAIRGADEGA